MGQEQTNDAIWNRLDEHGKAINKIQTEVAISASDIEHLKRQGMDICTQLIATKTEIMGVVSTTNLTVNGLKEKDLLREGAKSQWKLIGGIIAVIYTIMQLLILVKTFSGS